MGNIKYKVNDKVGNFIIIAEEGSWKKRETDIKVTRFVRVRCILCGNEKIGEPNRFNTRSIVCKCDNQLNKNHPLKSHLNEYLHGLKVIEDLGIKLPNINSKNKKRFVRVQCILCLNILEGRYAKFKDRLKICPCNDKRKIIKVKKPFWLILMKKWHNMKSRCYSKDNSHFYLYGEKGIKLCDEWLNSFDSFYNWSIANNYKEGLTIERKDVNKGYHPENCTWIASKLQSRNRSNTLKANEVKEIKLLLAEGYTCRQISTKFKVPIKRIYYIKSGLTWNDTL